MSTFSDALYYPEIDISNARWIKTAVLFWDAIYTIVPETLDTPYLSQDTKYLADIGFLRPLRVKPDDAAVIATSKEFLALVTSPKFMSSLEISDYDSINKLVYRNYLHRDKVSKTLFERIEMFLFDSNLNYTREKFGGKSSRLIVNRDFILAYMISLASKLSEENSLCLVTDDSPCFSSSNLLRTSSARNRLFERPSRHQYEQGLLLDLIINGLSISPDATLTDVISFKCHHRDELGRFKQELDRLTGCVPADLPVSAIQSEVNNIYTNSFLPAFNDLKSSLSDFRVDWFSDTFLKISTLSVSSSGFMTLMGMPVTQALLATSGISLVASAISYNIAQKKNLRKNPCSYLLSINNEYNTIT